MTIEKSGGKNDTGLGGLCRFFMYVGRNVRRELEGVGKEKGGIGKVCLRRGKRGGIFGAMVVNERI